MSSAGAPLRAGNPVALVVASEDVDTPRPCRHDPSVLVSTHPLDPVVLVEDSAVALEAEASVVVGIAATASVLAVASATKEVAMALADRRQMPPLDLVADVEDLVVEVADSTGAQRAATGSLCGPATAMQTVTVVTTVMGTATGTATACPTAMETGTATGTATGMAAGRTMGANETVKMKAMTAPAPGDDTKCSLIEDYLSFPLLSPNLLVGIPDLSTACPCFHKGKGSTHNGKTKERSDSKLDLTSACGRCTHKLRFLL